MFSWAATPPKLGFAYFYKPPADHTSVAFMAHHFQLILLTHEDEAYMAQLRHDGYRGPILQTVAANEAEGPGPYANAKANCDAAYVPYHRTVADRRGVFCSKIHPHESWFLHNRHGQRLYTRHQSGNGVWRTVYEMNPGSRGWRRFVIARLRQYRSHLRFDGFFFDNVDLSRAGLLRQMADQGGVAEYANDAQFRAAVAGDLAAIRAAFPGVPLWANLTHDPEERGDWNAYLPYLNGVMVEDFALGWKDAALPPPAGLAQLANIQSALAHGNSVLVVAQGSEQDQLRRRFTLALAWALLPARGKLYYRYNNAGTDDYRQVWWSQLYRFIPAEALGPLQCQHMQCSRLYSGGMLTLDFAHTRISLPRYWFAATRPAATPIRGVRRKAPPRGGR
ncbi:MAG: putative glycoside hydrolase [Terriglobales bacterium]